jgi:hypothetical protein
MAFKSPIFETFAVLILHLLVLFLHINLLYMLNLCDAAEVPGTTRKWSPKAVENTLLRIITVASPSAKYTVSRCCLIPGIVRLTFDVKY